MLYSTCVHDIYILKKSTLYIYKMGKIAQYKNNHKKINLKNKKYFKKIKNIKKTLRNNFKF